MIEIKVRIKNESKSCTYKDMIYDDIHPQDDHDPVIKSFLDACVKSFGDDPEKISYSLLKVIQ